MKFKIEDSQHYICFNFSYKWFGQTHTNCTNPKVGMLFVLSQKHEKIILRHIFWCYCNCIYMWFQSDIFSSKFLERKSFRMNSLFEAFDKLRSKKYHIFYIITITIASCKVYIVCIKYAILKSVPTLNSELLYLI